MMEFIDPKLSEEEIDDIMKGNINYIIRVSDERIVDDNGVRIVHYIEVGHHILVKNRVYRVCNIIFDAPNRQYDKSTICLAYVKNVGD